MMYLSSNDKSSMLCIKDQQLDVEGKPFLMRLLNSGKYNNTSMSRKLMQHSQNIVCATFFTSTKMK